MTADSLYRFGRSPTASTRYLLAEHRGADVSGFPAVYVRGVNRGTAYVGFRETVNSRPGHRRFTHTIEGAGGRTFTGLNFSTENPRKAYGDYGNDALLVEFSENRETLTVLFFRGMKESARSLFQSWTAGRLAETAAADALPLDMKKAG